jgi:hypothetical protein
MENRSRKTEKEAKTMRWMIFALLCVCLMTSQGQDSADDLAYLLRIEPVGKDPGRFRKILDPLVAKVGPEAFYANPAYEKVVRERLFEVAENVAKIQEYQKLRIMQRGKITATEPPWLVALGGEKSYLDWMGELIAWKMRLKRIRSDSPAGHAVIRIAAPLLFVRSEPLELDRRSPPEMTPQKVAINLIEFNKSRGIPRYDTPRSEVDSSYDYLKVLQDWWIEHATDYGAELPSPALIERSKGPPKIDTGDLVIADHETSPALIDAEAEDAGPIDGDAIPSRINIWSIGVAVLLLLLLPLCWWAKRWYGYK